MNMKSIYVVRHLNDPTHFMDSSKHTEKCWKLLCEFFTANLQLIMLKLGALQLCKQYAC